MRWVYKSGNIQDKNHILSSMIPSYWREMTTSSLQSNNNNQSFPFLFQKNDEKTTPKLLNKKDVIITPV